MSAPERLPVCIPITWRDPQGRYCLAYPRSPWEPRRYQVVRCDSGPDLDCTVDDFGDLVPVRVERQIDPIAMVLVGRWRTLAEHERASA